MSNVSPRAAVERSLATIDEHESRVRAWAFLDPDRARRVAERAGDGPLHGMTLGVKDVFDTSDQPTEFGSPIYAGNQPRADAAAVALLRTAGAVVIGKTATAEFAWFSPAATTNPHRPTHTPGGSSSGSAAAVAAGMVDVALGTQTAGSVIRPASFCGVFGFKPTFGSVSTAGVKPVSHTCDTVGLFARDTPTLAAAFVALTGRTSNVARPVHIALMRTDDWAALDDDARRAVEEAARHVGADEQKWPDELVGLASAQPIVQAYEGVRNFAWERAFRANDLSTNLRAILEWGAAISSTDYDAVMQRAALARRPEALELLFGSADVLLTAAVVGEAPEGLDATGDPRFCRLWTLLGLPTVSVPGLVGSTGLPIGVQLVARPNRDHLLLETASHVAAALA